MLIRQKENYPSLKHRNAGSEEEQWKEKEKWTIENIEQ